MEYEVGSTSMYCAGSFGSGNTSPYCHEITGQLAALPAVIKVNSALTWSLARILRAPEVRRIYVGSFWDQPLQPSYLGELFERESHALLADLASCPRNNTTTKLNDLVMRTRRVRVQACLPVGRSDDPPPKGSSARRAPRAGTREGALWAKLLQKNRGRDGDGDDDDELDECVRMFVPEPRVTSS